MLLRNTAVASPPGGFGGLLVRKPQEMPPLTQTPLGIIHCALALLHSLGQGQVSCQQVGSAMYGDSEVAQKVTDHWLYCPMGLDC